jgi:hypothetical protein
MSIAVDGVTRSRILGQAYGLMIALAIAVSFAVAAPNLAAAQQSAPAEYSQQELEAFAAATQRVQELNEKWIPQISQAETADENAAMRQRAMQEMEAAVQEEGLTVQEYNSIYDAAQRDPAIMQQVEKHRESLQ